MPVTKISRTEILETAAGLIRARGYHRTSMEEIGAACGLQKGSFYHHFKSKRDMMHAILSEYTKRFAEEAHGIAFDESLSAAQRIKGILKASDMIFPGTDGCLMANTVLETANTVPQFRPVIRTFFDSWIDAFTHVFAMNHAPREARALAVASVGDIEGAMILMRLHKDRSYVIDAAKRVLARVEQSN